MKNKTKVALSVLFPALVGIAVGLSLGALSKDIGEVRAKADLYDRIVKATKTGDNEYGHYGEFMWNALEALEAQDSSPERHLQIVGEIFWPENIDKLGQALDKTLCQSATDRVTADE